MRGFKILESLCSGYWRFQFIRSNSFETSNGRDGRCFDRSETCRRCPGSRGFSVRKEWSTDVWVSEGDGEVYITVILLSILSPFMTWIIMLQWNRFSIFSFGRFPSSYPTPDPFKGWTSKTVGVSTLEEWYHTFWRFVPSSDLDFFFKKITCTLLTFINTPRITTTVCFLSVASLVLTV